MEVLRSRFRCTIEPRTGTTTSRRTTGSTKTIGYDEDWILTCIDHRCPLKEVHCPKHRDEVRNVSKLVEAKAFHLAPGQEVLLNLT